MWCIAHRGASADAPENTLAAFDLALTSPIDGIEFDVQLTQDEVPVVFHDWTLRRINGRGRRIVRLQHKELCEIDLGSWFSQEFCNERLATLQDVLERYSGRCRLLIELKSNFNDRLTGRSIRLAEQVIHSVRTLASGRDLYILSFDREILLHISKREPSLRTVLNLNPDARHLRLPGARYQFLSGLGVSVDRLVPDSVAKVRDEGRLVFTYTCNTEAQIELARTSCVDAILSDRPAWLCAQLGREQPATTQV